MFITPYIYYLYTFLNVICVISDDDSFASERDVQPTDDLVTSFVFNRNHSVSIQSQREQLPIFAHRDQILYSLEHYQTLVLVGETGCGKSTQVPQVSTLYDVLFIYFFIILFYEFDFQTNLCFLIRSQMKWNK